MEEKEIKSKVTAPYWREAPPEFLEKLSEVFDEIWNDTTDDIEI